jgi:class 3 adenylate cyclase
MNKDFEVFQWKIFSALTPNVPLQDNLRAVMAPALRKLNRYCLADIALHIFSNPELREWHVMSVDAFIGENNALIKELYRRHNPDDSLIPSTELPDYIRVSLDNREELQNTLKRDTNERLDLLKGELLNWFVEFTNQIGIQFPDQPPREGDSVIIMPLGSAQFPRLGHILLWASSDKLKETFRNSSKREGRIAFRKGMESLIVRIFSNFYRMEPHTYLPSYYQVQDKNVTLLCAEIRDFDWVASILQQRYDFTDKLKNTCLRMLVSGFNEITTKIVEKYHGRVDQIWGSGLVAIFSEYLDTPDASPKPGCFRAVAAAADIVIEFRDFAQEWLKNDFCLDHYKEQENAFFHVTPAVAIDYGKVLFDYVGSPKHKVFMALGNRVSFVKQLAGIAGRIEVESRYFISSAGSNSYHSIPGNIIWMPDFLGAPILLSQSAHEWSKDSLIDVPGSPSQQVHIPFLINVPGRMERFPVYAINPENVSRLTVIS